MGEYKPQDLAERTADVISMGWWQGSSRGPNNTFCAIGAIDQAALELDKAGFCAGNYWSELMVAAAVYLRDEVGFEPDDDNELNIVAQWNDNPDRTQDEVVDMWKHVAKKFANGEFKDA